MTSEAVYNIEKVIAEVDSRNPFSRSSLFPIHPDYYKALFNLCGRKFDPEMINKDHESRLLILGMQESMILFADRQGVPIFSSSR